MSLERERTAAATAVESRMFRALAVLRVLLLLNAVAWNVYRFSAFRSPTGGGVAIAVMVVWTAVALRAYDAPRRRTFVLLAADLAITLGVLLATPLLKGEHFRSTVPGIWILGALFAWAIRYRTAGGAVAGLSLAIADLAQRSALHRSDWGNAFLLVVGGAAVGFVCESLQRLATERDAAQRVAAMAEERARLARAVHDGVLQVLALVQRRGREVPALADLGELAGEQERALRALVLADETPVQGETLDLTAALTWLQRSSQVTVSTPGFPVELPARTVRELVAAAGACLDNVRMHVGEDAPVWLLLQAFPDRVELSVRDEGPGIPPGRLEEAAATGRLGVAESIRGRLADLGGRAEVFTGSFGTEWELVVPREAP